MKVNILSTLFRTALNGLPILLLSACALHPTKTAAPTYYSLDSGIKPVQQIQAALPASAPTLLIAPMLAASGFDSNHIIYTRVAHQQEYFARSLWIDTPSHMITPLMATVLADSGAFLAVALTTSAVAGDLRLNTELVRLEHDFSAQSAQMRFTLRATVLDNGTRKVLAWREFNENVTAASDSPYDGIKAANSAVQAGLQELSVFCADVARQWQAKKLSAPATIQEATPAIPKKLDMD